MSRRRKKKAQIRHDLARQASPGQTTPQVIDPEVSARLKAQDKLKHEKKQRRRQATDLFYELNELPSDSDEYYELLIQLLEFIDVLPDIYARYKNDFHAKTRADAELLGEILANPARLDKILENKRTREFYQIKRREILSGLQGGKLTIRVPINEYGPSFTNVTTSLFLQRIKESAGIEGLEFEALDLEDKPDHMGVIRAELILYVNITVPLQIVLLPAEYNIPTDLESELETADTIEIKETSSVPSQIEELLSTAERQLDVLAKADTYLQALRLMLDQGFSKTEEFTRTAEEYRKLRRPREIAIRLHDKLVHFYVDVDENSAFLLPLPERQVLKEIARLVKCDLSELSLTSSIPTQLGQHSIPVYYNVPARMEEWLLGDGLLDIHASKQRFESPRDTSDYYFSQALVHREKKDYDQARFFFEKALSHDPSLDVYLRYAVMERGRQNFDRARSVLERGLRRYPDGIKLYEDYGLLERRQGNYAKATEIYAGAASKTRGRRRAFFQRLLGETLMEMGRYEDALQQFAVARRLDPQRFRKIKKVVFQYDLARLHASYPDVVPTLEFLKQANFEVVDILELHKGRVDLLVQPLKTDYETYNLTAHMFMRHFIKTSVTREDMAQLIQRFKTNITTFDINQEVIFVVLQDTSRIRDSLYQRIENPRESLYIVPIEKNEVTQALADSNSSSVLSGILANWLGRRDLYQANTPVRGRHFFGREQPLRELVAHIDSGNHVGIFGLRKVGKTSFLLHLLEREREDIVVFLDLQRVPVRDCRYLYMEIGNQLVNDIKNKYPQLLESVHFALAGKYDRYGDLPSAGKVRARFDDDLRAVRRQLLRRPELGRVQILILLDEAETMLPAGSRTGFEGYIDFFRYLRGLSQQDNCLVSVIAAANPAICEKAQWGGQDNPVFGFYHKTFLPPLERDECDEMITELGQGMGVSYTPESLEQIYRNAGGHPFIARQLCSAVIRRFDTRPLLVDNAAVEQGIHEYIFSEATVFQEIMDRLERDFPTEKKILVALARAEGPLPFHALRIEHRITEDALRHLVGYQLTERLGDAYQIKIGLLRRWLREKWLNLES